MSEDRFEKLKRQERHYNFWNPQDDWLDLVNDWKARLLIRLSVVLNIVILLDWFSGRGEPHTGRQKAYVLLGLPIMLFLMIRAWIEKRRLANAAKAASTDAAASAHAARSDAPEPEGMDPGPAEGTSRLDR